MSFIYNIFLNEFSFNKVGYSGFNGQEVKNPYILDCSYN